MLWQACKLLSKLRSGTKKSGFDAVTCSTDRPRMKYCEDQNGTIIYIRADQGHSHGSTINQFFTEIPLSWTEHIPHSISSNEKSILGHGVWAVGLSLRSTRKGCFFSLLIPQNPSSRQRKQSNRPDHDCIRVASTHSFCATAR